MIISLRAATDKDLDFMRRLRNDNRMKFFHTNKINPTQQKMWWDNFVGVFYIIYIKDIRVGTISISTFDEDTFEIGFEIGNVIIDKKYRGQGIFQECIKLLKKEYDRPYVLRVKGDNEEAIRAYKKAGFKVRSLTMEL